MALQFRLPSPEHVVRFVRAKSLSKKDWLKCPACGGPQLLCEGCCFDSECLPHLFKVDVCPHCGFDLRSTDDPKGYDVAKGKAARRTRRWRQWQREVVEQYEYFSLHPRYPDADGT